MYLMNAGDKIDLDDLEFEKKIMKFIKVKKKSRFENRYHKSMGMVKCRVTRIKYYLFGIIPLKTIHSYRETYYGEVKDIEDCKLSK